MRSSPVFFQDRFNQLRPFLGLPFKPHGRDFRGVDCWGLVYLFYREVWGIDLPRYDHLVSNVENPISIATVIKSLDQSDWILHEEPHYGDVLLFGSPLAPHHVGLFLDENLMLHTRKGTDATIERWTGPLWCKRLVGVYRHHDRS